MKKIKSIIDRKQLKEFFKNGYLPTEDHFAALIDSMFNKADDNINIDEENGLMIYPALDEAKLLSFFESKNEQSPKWLLLNSKGKGIYIKEVIDQQSKTSSKKGEAPNLYLESGGNVGIGTNSPQEKLEVKGVVESEGRIGNFRKIVLEANGRWHNVFGAEGLTGCHAFEIMAQARGNVGEGKYALMHAIALSTFGKSKSKIRKTSAHYGKWWNKIACRWVAEDTFKYNLQIKTKSNYGEGGKIYVNVTKLWDDSFMYSDQYLLPLK